MPVEPFTFDVPIDHFQQLDEPVKRLSEACSSVCVVKSTYNGTKTRGTGFLYGANSKFITVCTNAHVLDQKERVETAEFVFFDAAVSEGKEPGMYTVTMTPRNESLRWTQGYVYGFHGVGKPANGGGRVVADVAMVTFPTPDWYNKAKVWAANTPIDQVLPEFTGYVFSLHFAARTHFDVFHMHYTRGKFRKDDFQDYAGFEKLTTSLDMGRGASGAPVFKIFNKRFHLVSMHYAGVLNHRTAHSIRYPPVFTDPTWTEDGHLSEPATDPRSLCGIMGTWVPRLALGVAEGIPPGWSQTVAVNAGGDCLAVDDVETAELAENTDACSTLLFLLIICCTVYFEK
jgi:hypothetical protein